MSKSMQSTIHIMIVEDHPEYRDVLKLAISEEADLELINEFGTAEDALRSLQNMTTRKEPDVILLDLNLPGLSGIKAIPYFQSAVSTAKIIVLTQSNREADVVKAVRQGASGYLLKSSTLTQITEGIRSVKEGGAPIDAHVANYILKSLKSAPIDGEALPALSDRELEILTLIAKGHVKKEIAEQLGISVYTVVTHSGHIYEKLNVVNAPSAVDKAHTLGLFRSK